MKNIRKTAPVGGADNLKKTKEPPLGALLTAENHFPPKRLQFLKSASNHKRAERDYNSPGLKFNPLGFKNHASNFILKRSYSGGTIY